MSMDINTRVGQKVIVSKEAHNAGKPEDKILAMAYLKPGEIYTIKWIEAADYCTQLILKELPAIPFNSVHFDNL